MQPQADLEARLIELVRSSTILMRALRIAQAVGPPEWLIGSGVIRDLVWSELHGFQRPGAFKDVDLVFFEPVSGEDDREAALLGELRVLAPDIPWDVTNQATVHLWYERTFGIVVEPLRGLADAIATWPETASAVGVRLDVGEVRVVAPFGLEDLFAMVWRRNPRWVTVEEYRRRIESKRIAQRWPRVRIMAP